MSKDKAAKTIGTWCYIGAQWRYYATVGQRNDTKGRSGQLLELEKILHEHFRAKDLQA